MIAIFWVYINGYQLNARCFTVKSLSLSLKSHAHECALKLTDLWITSLLFVRICRVRALKEGKYQLSIAIFDVRDGTPTLSLLKVPLLSFMF